MIRMHAGTARAVLARVAAAFRAPQTVAVLPALTTAGYAILGEAGLLSVALAIPILYAFAGLATGAPPRPGAQPLPRRDAVVSALQGVLDRDDGRTTGAFVVEIDRHRDLCDRLGHRTVEDLLAGVFERLRATMRAGDTVASLDGGCYAVALGSVSRLDLEILIQIAGRLQAAVAEPMVLGGTSIRMTACIGFCDAGAAPVADGAGLLDAADTALIEARRQGPGSIRAYCSDLHRRRKAEQTLQADATDALETGEIRAWFQPQVSTDTGRVTGFEALARWVTPTGGMVSPGEFLPALDEAGLMPRLGEVMLYRILTALRDWDRAGVEVPRVALNLSPAELADPGLADKIGWELDRFDIAPSRLALEILETVIAGAPDDMTVRNIERLSDLGCPIDLDDFGTGNASITSLRRFAIGRIKIDRSFVHGIDEDSEQQRMIDAILTMADRLDLQTLAEGVETVGEHAMLAQLGCGHVQGFGIGRPMPFEETIGWLDRHNRTIAATPRFGANES